MFQRQKVKKKSQNSRNQGFSYYFCLTIEVSGSVPHTNGSGSATLVFASLKIWNNLFLQYSISRPLKIDKMKFFNRDIPVHCSEFLPEFVIFWKLRLKFVLFRSCIILNLLWSQLQAVSLTRKWKFVSFSRAPFPFGFFYFKLKKIL
jgi:hypothetical protein